MTFDELTILRSSDTSNLPFQINSLSAKENLPIINGMIVLPVEGVASYYKTNADISIFDPLGNEIGFLCFTKEIGDVTKGELTEMKFIAFLNEVSSDKIDESFKFSRNYLVIKETYYEDYINKYKETSQIWGGFFHATSELSFVSYSKVVTEIKISELELKSKIYKENSIRAVMQPFSFERFLKLYHLLELRFDFDIIDSIKKLDVEKNSEEIGKIFRDYSSREFPRLLDIIMKNCTNVNPIVDKLNNVKNYLQQSTDIFYKFGKEINPLEQLSFNKLALSGFEENNFISFKINRPGGYKNSILKLTTYWIYRVRCCIAHSKIGEYILTANEEEFIVEFAEPILKEVIIQCFKK